MVHAVILAAQRTVSGALRRASADLPARRLGARRRSRCAAPHRARRGRSNRRGLAGRLAGRLLATPSCGHQHRGLRRPPWHQSRRTERFNNFPAAADRACPAPGSRRGLNELVDPAAAREHAPAVRARRRRRYAASAGALGRADRVALDDVRLRGRRPRPRGQGDSATGAIARGPEYTGCTMDDLRPGAGGLTA